MTVSVIDSRDISVVIQGPTCRGDGSPEKDLGLICVKSIREHLPHAEIIISTWKNDSVEGLGECIVVRSDDPGGMPDINGFSNNINRQLVSTLVGIKQASRPYILKFRADHSLTSNKIASVREYEEGLNEFRLFSKPITMTNLYIRKVTKYPFLFHISDLVQFGTKEDMLMLWDGPLFSKEDVFLPKNRKNPAWGNFAGPTSLKHVPEQSLTLRLLAKKGIAVYQPYLSYINPTNVILWEKVLITNFYVLNWDTSGVEFPTRFTSVHYTRVTIYTEDDIALIREQMKKGNYHPRYIVVWYNKYFGSLVDLNGLVPLVASLLFRVSPRLTYSVRKIWKKINGTTR